MHTYPPGKMTPQTIYSNGIYHGLPCLDDAPNGLTAVVTGANGISGAHMIRVLAQNTKRWTKIYALSRRPPSGQWPSTVEHVPLDFLTSPKEIASVLESRGVKPDYVFFFSYILVTDESGALQWGDQRLVDQNSTVSKSDASRQRRLTRYCFCLRPFTYQLPGRPPNRFSNSQTNLRPIRAEVVWCTSRCHRHTRRGRRRSTGLGA